MLSSARPGLIPELKKQRQENHGFKASLDYIKDGGIKYTV